MPESIYRRALPQLTDEVFLTDGGLETTLIFLESFDLPEFASFPLLESDDGRKALHAYFAEYVTVADEQGLGIVLETPTWRANPDWGAAIGYSPERLDELNRAAVDLLLEVRERRGPNLPTVISGQLGPRGDGYVPDALMSAEEAAAYHGVQIGTFADTAADLVTALTINYPAEAIGIARAASEAAIPSVISFTVETDGRLPTGEALEEAIEQVDAATDEAPAYYMINCAHPTHFADSLSPDQAALRRIRGLRANASTMSHEELDAMEELDDGDPQELGQQYRALRETYPHISVLGGCCGTDHRHVDAIGQACVEA